MTLSSGRIRRFYDTGTVTVNTGRDNCFFITSFPNVMCNVVTGLFEHRTISCSDTPNPMINIFMFVFIFDKGN